MKALKLTASLILISILFISTIAVGENSSVGEFVKDSAITTQIKSKILVAKDIDSLHIKVDTDNNGIVVLNRRSEISGRKRKECTTLHMMSMV